MRLILKLPQVHNKYIAGILCVATRIPLAPGAWHWIMNTAEVGLIRQVGQDLIQLKEQQGDGNAQQHYDQLLPETRW